MSISDIIQAVSLLAVVVTLLLSLKQNREMVKQTQEATRQTAAAASSLRRDSIHGMIHHVLDFTYAAMARDPALLSWFLAVRGFPPNLTDEENHRHLFLWMRLGMHQSHFMERMDGLISDDVWGYWLTVIQYDVGSPGFDTVWKAIAHTYVLEYRAFIDNLIEERDARVTQQVQ